MPYKLAIFDFDGTLADSFAWFSRVVNDAAEVFTFRKITSAEIDMLRGKGARENAARQAASTCVKKPLAKPQRRGENQAYRRPP